MLCLVSSLPAVCGLHPPTSRSSYLSAPVPPVVQATPSSTATQLPDKQQMQNLGPRGGVLKYYAVRKGKKTGVFYSWDEVQPLVSGFPGAVHKSFKSYQEALQFASGSASGHNLPSYAQEPAGPLPYYSESAAVGSKAAGQPAELAPAAKLSSQRVQEQAADGSQLTRPQTDSRALGTLSPLVQPQTTGPAEQPQLQVANNHDLDGVDLDELDKWPAQNQGKSVVDQPKTVVANTNRTQAVKAAAAQESTVSASGRSLLPHIERCSAVAIQADRVYRIEFDGASKGNPGPAGCGAAIIDTVTGQQVLELWQYVGDRSTNNVAEYSGLLAGLKAAKDLGVCQVIAQGDSKLVVCQMKGTWKVNEAHLRKLRDQALEVTRGFKNFKIQHVLREHNTIADALSNRAVIGR